MRCTHWAGFRLEQRRADGQTIDQEFAMKSRRISPSALGVREKAGSGAVNIC